MSRSLFLLLILIQPLGSLPPTRGTHTVYFILSPFLRFTPACAGNTDKQLPVSHIPRDHPRLRGEHKYTVLEMPCLLGSPPPTRGTLIRQKSIWAGLGITPAYAGNTAIKISAIGDIKDHPRLRGEHQAEYGVISKSWGSPPPTRGTRGKMVQETLKVGITPAYAGNTCQRAYIQCNTWDHPRLRGEHPLDKFEVIKAIGSPPPTRGTLQSTKDIQVNYRITPAYAGNTI